MQSTLAPLIIYDVAKKVQVMLEHLNVLMKLLLLFCVVYLL